MSEVRGSGGNLNNCTFDNVYIQVSEGNPSFSNCTFKNVNYPYILEDMGALPTITNTVLVDVKYGEIGIGYDVTGDFVLRKYELDYRLNESMSLTGGTFTVESGVSIDLNNKPITIGKRNEPGFLNADNVVFMNSASSDEYIVATNLSCG